MDNEIEKCKECGKTTEHMYPLKDFFLCEEHRGTIMGMPLCCSKCFERYIPNFPERAAMWGEWSGHCGSYFGICPCHLTPEKKEKEDQLAKGEDLGAEEIQNNEN